MATYVKGDAIANATYYELAEKNSGGTYTPLDTNTDEINFDLDELGLEAGTHTLVVKAVGDGVTYEDSDYSNEVVYTVSGDSGEDETNTNVVFNFDFTANTLDDYALEDVFTVPDNSTVSEIEYDSTYGMSLNSNLPNGLNFVEPIDASKAWELEFTALFVTPTVLAGNRRSFLAGDDLYPFVFINGSTEAQMGFQISNGTHATKYGDGVLVYDEEATYKIVYNGNGSCEIFTNGTSKGTVSVNFAGQTFTVMLGNVKGKSSAYVWQNVETNKSYLKKIKFTYTE